MNNLNNILLKDIYIQLNNILINIADKYKIDYQELHDLYLKPFLNLN